MWFVDRESDPNQFVIVARNTGRGGVLTGDAPRLELDLGTFPMVTSQKFVF